MLALLKELAWVDTLTIGAIAVLVILGFVRGCSGELGRLVALCVAAAVGYFGLVPVSRVVLTARLFDANPYAGRLVAYILLFVICIALWLGLRHLLAEAIRLVVRQPFDAILGGVIGGVKAFVLVAVLCTFGLLNPNEAARTQFQNESATAKQLAPLLKRITSPGT